MTEMLCNDLLLLKIPLSRYSAHWFTFDGDYIRSYPCPKVSGLSDNSIQDISRSKTTANDGQVDPVSKNPVMEDYASLNI
jgi:hypothetical protein